MSDVNNAPKGAAELTAQANAVALENMSFDDDADFERAQHGLIATLPEGTVTVDDHVVWDCARYDFLRETHEAPNTVHP